MSKKIRNSHSKQKTENVIKSVLYLRLSDEDRDKLTKEEKSESIKNQEKMLKNYAIEHGFKNVGIYNDEDWSGSDATRPEFNKMISECEKGNVDVVLCKTQARFARDMELIEKYVHNKFVEWNVRFITVVDRIDNTRRETKKTSQILGLTDEWYLEDTSLNIRETFKAKRSEGEFTGSFTPYGYKRDPENKNHLIPDNVVSEIIVRIFEEYSKGYGMPKIAKKLTDDNVLSPLEYKLMNGSNLKLPIIKDYTNYSSINKSGVFIIKVDYLNKERQIIKNLTTIEILTDNIFFSNKINISLKRKKDNTIIYYSVKSLDELNIKVNNNRYVYDKNSFNIDSDFKVININETIPKNTTCILTVTKDLDRTHRVSYEFEAILKENRNHNIYEYKVYPTSDNKDVNLQYNIQIRNKHKWSDSTIKKILKDEVYIGNLVQFKTTTVSYKNHAIIYNDESKRIRVQNTHEPIINDELWNIVQDRLEQNKKSCSNGKCHVLVNKVFCENCNKVFCKCGKNDENGLAYLCCSDKSTKWSNCDNNKYIKQIELLDYIKDKINILLKNFYKEERQIKINDNMVENDLFKKQIVNLNMEKQNILREFKCKESYFQGLYEDRKKGFINDDEYLFLRNKYKEDFSQLKDRLEIIDNSLKAVEIKQSALKDKKILFKKYKQINKLNVEIVNDLIDKVIIGKYNKETNQRKIHIIWNFIS